jgi:hypothetical protein
LVILGDFAEVIPTEASLASAADGFHLQDVMRMKTKIMRGTTCKGVGHRLTKLQQDGTCDHPGLSHLALFGKQQPHSASWAQPAPQAVK